MHQASLSFMKTIRTLILSLITAAVVSSVSAFSITSPDICLSTLECPTNSFCNQTDVSQLPRCARRLPANAPCGNVGLNECKQGFTCLFDDTIPGDNPVCRRRGRRGARCRLDEMRPCAGSLVCERNTTTCQPFKDGFTGTPCEFDRHCQQDKGFYCQTEPGVCAPKRGPGGECDRAADNFECLGFCVSRSFNDGVCVSARKEGELCTGDSDCENNFFRTLGPREDELLCNIPTGNVGRCIRASRLLKRLGAGCDPQLDRCDATRSLSCSATRRGRGSGRNVCQHRLSRFDRQFQEFCEPRSHLSRCHWGDVKTECRRERVVPGDVEEFGPFPFFVCRRQSERVPRGGICLREYAACEPDTECREVPGLEREDLGPNSERYPLPQGPFCVRVVEKGGRCGGVKDKFTTQCAKGLRCNKKGRCVKAEEGEPPFDDKVTHAGIRAFCKDLPCAPGLVCEKDERGSKKRCVLPLRIVGEGRECMDHARERRRCADGLVCALRKDGTNVRRCRVARKEGDFCELDSDCAKGLICPFIWTGNREQEERRCYNPEMTLKIGETCDPESNGSQPRCVIDERADPDLPGDTISRPMRCLTKGDGFACRVVVGLFEFCDEAKDIVCDDGLQCGSLGVCVAIEDH